MATDFNLQDLGYYGVEPNGNHLPRPSSHRGFMPVTLEPALSPEQVKLGPNLDTSAPGENLVKFNVQATWKLVQCSTKHPKINPTGGAKSREFCSSVSSHNLRITQTKTHTKLIQTSLSKFNLLHCIILHTKPPLSTCKPHLAWASYCHW